MAGCCCARRPSHCQRSAPETGRAGGGGKKRPGSGAGDAHRIGLPQRSPPDVDDLRAQLALANTDSELARAATPGAPRAFVPALTQIAGERALHAQAIADEISRTLGTLVPATTSATATPTSTASGGTPAPTRPPSVDDVVAALRISGDSAARSAARESGYRAGLLASIAASCAASYTVALAAPRPAP